MDLMTVKDVSDRLKITIGRVHQLIKAGRLPAEKLGSQYVIRKTDLPLVEIRKPGRPTAKPL